MSDEVKNVWTVATNVGLLTALLVFLAFNVWSMLKTNARDARHQKAIEDQYAELVGRMKDRDGEEWKTEDDDDD